MIELDPALRERLASFYAYETMLLDENRLREWLDLFDESVRYVMPMRTAFFKSRRHWQRRLCEAAIYMR